MGIPKRGCLGIMVHLFRLINTKTLCFLCVMFSKCLWISREELSSEVFLQDILSAIGPSEDPGHTPSWPRNSGHGRATSGILCLCLSDDDKHSLGPWTREKTSNFTARGFLIQPSVTQNRRDFNLDYLTNSIAQTWSSAYWIFTFSFSASLHVISC